MWLVIGLVLGAAILALVLWIRNNKVAVRWYEWLIAVIGLGLLLFSIPNFTSSFAEREPTAAWMFLLVLILPAVILMAIAFRLIWHRSRAV